MIFYFFSKFEYYSDNYILGIVYFFGIILKIYSVFCGKMSFFFSKNGSLVLYSLFWLISIWSQILCSIMTIRDFCCEYTQNNKRKIVFYHF